MRDTDVPHANQARKCLIRRERLKNGKGPAHCAGRADRKSAQDLNVEQDSATFKPFFNKLLDRLDRVDQQL